MFPTFAPPAPPLPQNFDDVARALACGQDVSAVVVFAVVTAAGRTMAEMAAAVQDLADRDH